MAIKLNKQDNKLFSNYLLKYLIKRHDLSMYNDYLEKKYNQLLYKNKSNNYFEIENKFYFYNNIVNLNSNLDETSLEKFIEDNYKKMLFCPDLDADMYYVKVNNININPNNFVQNGSLVLILTRLLNYNINAKQRVLMLKELDDDIIKIEKELSNVLEIPIRILCYDVIIPPMIQNK